MLALSRRTAIGMASIAIIVSCGHSAPAHTEAEYLEMEKKLSQAYVRQQGALTAAAMDRNSYSALAMMTAVNQYTRRSREEGPSIDAMLKMSRKSYYEMKLHDYNEINKILRAYGFGEIAIDFDPSK